MTTFSDKEKLAIAQCFSGEAGIIALAALSRFAEADQADFIQKPRLLYYLQGRRSVICKIKEVIAK